MASTGKWPAFGPSHQDGRRKGSTFHAWLGFWFIIWLIEWPSVIGAVVILGGAYAAWFVMRVFAIRWAELDQHDVKIAEAADPGKAVIDQAQRQGGGIYLGTDEKGRWRYAPPEHGVLLLGPPRSGKTTGVIVPAMLSHAGAAVSTSTKPDVLRATLACRERLGEVWQFDPTGIASESAGRELRWSPVSCCGVWDEAVVMARAMVLGSGVGQGTTDASHWSKRAQALLASLLHAAVAGERDIAQVLDWVMRHETDEPGMLLGAPTGRQAGARAAARSGEHRGAGALLDLLGRRRRPRRLQLPRRARCRRGSELRPGAVRALERHRLYPRARASTRPRSRRWCAGSWRRSAARPTPPPTSTC